MEGALKQMEEQASKTAGASRQAYAEAAGKSGGGHEGAGKAAASDLYLQADAIDAINTKLASTIEGIAAVPRKLETSIRSIQSSINRAVEIAEGRGRTIVGNRIVQTGTPGGTQIGSAEQQVQAIVRRGIVSAATGGFARTAAPTGIASVRRSDIDRANFDRVVLAIRAQTRVIEGGIRVTGGAVGVANVVEGAPGIATAKAPRKKAAAKPATDVEADTAKLKNDIDTVRANLAENQAKADQIIELIGANVDEASQHMLDTLAGVQQNMKAQQAQLERYDEGISKTEQKRRRRAAADAARKAQETITDVEKERRATQARLIASPGAADFEARGVPRARTPGGGNYSKEELMRMVQAFRELGIEIKANTNTTKEQLVARLREAHAQYREVYPGGAPQLATRGVNVTRTTKMSSETEELLGDINALTTLRTEAGQILATNRRGGGTGPLPKGREGVGAGILGTEIGLVQTRGGTPQDVQAAYKAFERDIEGVMGRVRDLATGRGFNPYAEHRIEIPGEAGPERQKGLAAAARLADIRGATKELDSLATRLYDFKEAIAESRAFIGRATERLKRGEGKDTDQANIAAARTRITENERLIGEIPENLRKLFGSSEFKAGYATREGPQYGYTREGAPIGSRMMLETRAEARGGRSFTESDYKALTQSMVSAVVGYRTAIGSRETIRNIPGLGSGAGGMLFRHSEGAISNEDQQKLDRATRQLAAAQVKHLHTINDVDATEEQVAETFKKLENAANKLANRLQKSFGLAPSIETLLGQTSYGKEGGSENFGGVELSRKTQKDEARRQAVRDKAVDRAARDLQSEHTAEEKAIRAADSLAIVTNKLARARENRINLEEKLAAAEEKVGRNMDPAARYKAMDKWVQLNEQAYGTQVDLNKLEGIRDLAEDVNRAGRSEVAVTPSGSKGNVARPAVAGGLAVEGHQFGPEQTLESTIKGLSMRLQNLLGQQRELVRRRTEGGLVADDHTELIGRTQSALEQARTLHAQYGGGTLNEVMARVQSQVQETLQQREVVGRGIGGIKGLEPLANELRTAENEVGRLEAEEAELAKTSERAAKAVNSETKAKEQGAKATVAETNGRLAELRAQQQSIRAEGPYRRSARKAAFARGGAEDPEYIAINERRARLKKVKEQIDQLEGAEGGGAGGGGGRTAAGAAGAGGGREGNNLLAQILAELKAFHASVSAGVPVKAGAAAATGGRRSPVTGLKPGEYGPKLPSPKARNDEERTAGIALQRQREEAAKNNQAAKEKVDADRKEAAAAAKSTAELQKQAQAKQYLDSVTGALSQETIKEVETLRQLTQASKTATTAAEKQAAAEKIAAQQTRVAGSVNRDLRDSLLKGGQRRQGVQAVLQSAGPAVSGENLNTVMRSAAIHPEFRQTMTAAGEGYGENMAHGTMDGFARIFGGGKGFFARVLSTTGTFLVRNFSAGLVFGLTNALQQVVTEAIQTEATFVRVSHALEATGRSSDGLRASLQGISTEFGTNLNDVYQTAAGLTGLFKTPQEIAGATKVVSQLQLISAGALNAQEAMGALASIQGAFAEDLGTGVDGLTHVADVLTTVQNVIGTNVEVTAEGVGRMSGLAHQLGLSIEEVAVYVAQVSKLTNQTGAAAGEQLSRIFSVMQTGRGRKAVQDAFGEVGGKKTNIEQQLGARDYGGVLETMSANWDKLTDSQKQNVSVTIAGQRQAAAFAALMSNGAQSLDAIARSEDSHGAAAERTAKIMQTLNGQIAKLGSNLQNVANNLIRSGILNFVQVLLQAVNGLLGTFNTLFSKLNDFVDSNPLLSWLTNIGVGIAGLAVAIGLLRKVFAGLRQSIRDVPMIQSFRKGYAGEAEGMVGQPGGPSLSQRGVERAYPIARGGTTRTSALPGFYGAGGDVGAPISRTLGKVLDRFVVPPFNKIGDSATHLSTVLRTRADEIRAAAAAPGVGPLTASQVAQNQRRADALQRRAGIVGGIGGAFGAIGTGAGEVFQGRGGAYFAGVAERRQASAGVYRLRAEELRGQAQNPRLLSGEGGALKRQAVVLDTLGASTKGVGKMASGLSKTLGGLEKAGMGADVALVGATLAVAMLVTAWEDNAAAAKRVRTIMDEEAKKERAKIGQDDPYLGVAQEQYKEFSDQLKDQNPFETGWKFVSHGFSDFIKGRSDKILTGETYNEMTGTTGGWASDKITGLDQANKAVDEAIKKVDDYAKQGKRESFDADLGVFSVNVTEGFTDPIEGIMVAQRENGKKFAKMKQDVNNNGDLSQQEKLASLAAIEQAEQVVIKHAEDQLAIANGLSAAGLLELEQIKRITQTMPTLAGLQNNPQLLQELHAGVQGLLQETGVDTENKEIKDYLDKLAKGGLSTAEVAVGQTKVLRNLAKQAEIKYLAALDSGETDQIDDARDTMTGLMNQLASATEQNVQIFVDTANAISGEAFAQGDYTGGQEALRKAIADIEAQKPKGTTTVDRGPTGPITTTTYTKAEQEQIRKFEAQQRALADQLTQSRIGTVNRPLQLKAGGGLGELAGAQNTLQQAQNTLGMLQASRDLYGDLGATQQQITDAQIAVLQAESGVAKAMQSKRAAQFALQAAQTWNEARQDNIAVKQAAYVLEEMIRQYGEDSIEALNAMAGLAQANKQRVENRIARRQARRETDLAQVSQLDPVAVAKKQMDNAAAAVADAERYGTNSQKYQNALAGYYSAQQNYWSAQHDQAMQAVQSASDVKMAQLGIASAYADARGDTVQAARIGIAVAHEAIALANAQLAMARTPQEVAAAQVAQLNAQAQLIGANAAYTQSIDELAQSKFDVAIALAEAGGHTVEAARRTLQAAQYALRAALKRSGGKMTTEVNQARVQAIQAEAQLRDARLQDDLDTIDFNLQMGKITQASAIHALQEILRTRDLTRDQRRQLLLQIKGMKDEMADSQWNFGNIKLPTPYQMRAYITARRNQFRRELDSAAVGNARTLNAGQAPVAGTVNNYRTAIQINGADINEVKKVIRETVGGSASTRTRTNGARRR